MSAFTTCMITTSLGYFLCFPSSTEESFRQTHKELKNTLTCVSVTFNSFAISALSPDDRYFFTSNSFSSSKICLPVNVVLAFFRLPTPGSSPSSLVNEPSPPSGDLTSSVDFLRLISFEGSGKQILTLFQISFYDRPRRFIFKHKEFVRSNFLFYPNTPKLDLQMYLCTALMIDT